MFFEKAPYEAPGDDHERLRLDDETKV